MSPWYRLFSLIFNFPSKKVVAYEKCLFQRLDLPERRNILYHSYRTRAVLQLIIIRQGLSAQYSRIKDFRACKHCKYSINIRLKIWYFIIIYVFLKALARDCLKVVFHVLHIELKVFEYVLASLGIKV